MFPQDGLEWQCNFEMVPLASFSPVYMGQGLLMSHSAGCGQGGWASISGVVSCSVSVNDSTDPKLLRFLRHINLVFWHLQTVNILQPKFWQEKVIRGRGRGWGGVINRASNIAEEWTGPTESITGGYITFASLFDQNGNIGWSNL